MGRGLIKRVFLLLGLFMVATIVVAQQQPILRNDPLFRKGFDIQGLWSYYEIRLQTNDQVIPTCIGTTNGFLKFDVKADRYEYRVEADNVDTHGNYFYETSSYPVPIYFDNMDLTHWPVISVRLNDGSWLRLKIVDKNCIILFFWLDEHKVTITSILHRASQNYFRRPLYNCPENQKYYRAEEGLDVLNECAEESN